MNKSIVVYKDGSYVLVDTKSASELQADQKWLTTIHQPYSEPAVYTKEYLDWVKQANLPPLTNTQHKFAEWLLKEDNKKIIGQIGNLNTIFENILKYIKK